MVRIALIGATGLIGRQLAPKLLGSGSDLLVLTRRPTGMRGIDERVAPMEHWPDILLNEVVDTAISTLGSTLNKAGSWDGFVAVDEVAVLDFAVAAKAAGARHFVFVSSAGADATSNAPYLALKGRVEQALRELAFERLDLIRPGLLRGERGSERRLGERVAILASPLTDWLLPKRLDRFRSIDAGQVATAMAMLCSATSPGQFVHENRELISLAS